MFYSFLKEEEVMKILKRSLLVSLIFLSCISIPTIGNTYPIYAQQSYENPREATGRIVCANCHLGQKPIKVETPKEILPDSVFETVVKFPYDENTQQLLPNGAKGPLNVGAVVILPEGFKLAPKERLSEELKNKTKGVFIQPYSSKKENILVVGPLPGKLYKEITFPILAPNPSNTKNVHFLKYPIYVGANLGRGQLYPSGEQSNNTVYTAPVEGQVTKIENKEKGGSIIYIEDKNGESNSVNLPPGLIPSIQEGDNLKTEQPLNKDPNVGGFGQAEIEFVLQSPNRITNMILFFFSILFTQIFLVLKKKQFERVQAAEMNF